MVWRRPVANLSCRPAPTCRIPDKVPPGAGLTVAALGGEIAWYRPEARDPIKAPQVRLGAKSAVAEQRLLLRSPPRSTSTQRRSIQAFQGIVPAIEAYRAVSRTQEWSSSRVWAKLTCRANHTAPLPTAHRQACADERPIRFYQLSQALACWRGLSVKPRQLRLAFCSSLLGPVRCSNAAQPADPVPPSCLPLLTVVNE